MDKMQFELQFKHSCPNVLKFYFSQKHQLYFIITIKKKHNKERIYNLSIFDSKTFKLLNKSKNYNKDFHPLNIYELSNDNFLIIFGSKYSKMGFYKYNNQSKKLDLIQTIIEKSENWDKNYSAIVKTLENPGESFYQSYLSDNSTILDLYNSNLIILFIDARGGDVWYNGDYEEDYWNILIFYKYNPIKKKYESIIEKKLNPNSIMHLKNSEILITVDYDKDEFRIGREKKWRYFIRKININDEKNSFVLKMFMILIMFWIAILIKKFF